MTNKNWYRRSGFKTILSLASTLCLLSFMVTMNAQTVTSSTTQNLSAANPMIDPARSGSVSEGDGFYGASHSFDGVFWRLFDIDESKLMEWCAVRFCELNNVGGPIAMCLASTGECRPMGVGPALIEVQVGDRVYAAFRAR